MVELAVNQLIKIIVGIFVFVAVVIGIYLFFKNYVIDFIKNLMGVDESLKIFLNLLK